MIPNTDITIYNKYTVNRSDAYQRAVVRRVVWQSTQAVSGRGSGRLSDNVAAIFIPVASAANYVPPKRWRTLASKAGTFTLAEGDLVIRGVVTDEISPTLTVSDLRRVHDDAVTITSVDAMLEGSRAVQHYEVGAK